MIGVGLIVFAVLMLAVHLASVALVAWRLGRPAPRGLIPNEPVTLIRPIRGLTALERETLASSFRQDHPNYRVLFCAQVPHDPAIAFVRSLIAAHPSVPATLLEGDAPHLRNPKLGNVLKGWEAATTRSVVMADSNLLLPPEYLSTLARLWGPGVGFVTSPAVGIRPESWGGHLECAFLNSNQARLQLLADCFGFGFAQGKTLVYDKPLLERLGGLQALDRELAEDVATTKLIRKAGLSIKLAPRPFPQPIGRRTIREVWNRQLRWAVIRRDGFPWLYAIEPLNGACLPLLAVVALAILGLLPWSMVLAYAALWWGAEWGLARLAGWPAGWKDAAVMPLRDALMPMIWFAGFFQRGFTWHGVAVSSGAPKNAA